METIMNKWRIIGIYYALLSQMGRIPIVDKILLKINSLEGKFIERLAHHTYHKRMAYLGEGGRLLYEDPDIDIYYRWKDPRWGKLFWAEQYGFNAMALSCFKKKKVLELCCGYGWYYLNFYAAMDSLEYVGCDISQQGIQEANRRLKKLRKQYIRYANKTLNASFCVADITKEIPLKNENVTNVFWYSSMYMFPIEVRKGILCEIAKRLAGVGILSGSIVIREPNQKEWEYAIALVDDEESLRKELLEHFKNVYIVKMSNNRRLYYMASDSLLPCINGK